MFILNKQERISVLLLIRPPRFIGSNIVIIIERISVLLNYCNIASLNETRLLLTVLCNEFELGDFNLLVSARYTFQGRLFYLSRTHFVEYSTNAHPCHYSSLDYSACLFLSVLHARCRR